MARYLVWQGIYMQASYGRAAGADTPMAAVTGQTRQEVEAALKGLEAVIGLTNAPRRFVISGQPDALKTAVERLRARSKAEHDSFDAGQWHRGSGGHWHTNGRWAGVAYEQGQLNRLANGQFP